MFNKKADNERKPPVEGQAFLITASDSIEADIIESKLATAEIPVYKKYRGPGAYLNIILGNTTMGIDLFVPEERIEEAKGLLESASDISDEEILADPSFHDETVKNKNQQNLDSITNKTIIMASVFIILIIAIIVLYAVRAN
ncbi:MAG TPA: DUF2007 domain-containing protein [Clostridiaceae bacterium]|jgi:subtilase family serine protease|nr:DUF2007 domain-containing protein [Clostridiaceae bacterium]